MGNKVLCRFCKFETDERCTRKKNSKVKLTKRRSCNLYIGDEDKIVVYAEKKANSPEATLRPDWFWSRSKRRKERDKLIQQEMERYQTTANKDISLPQQPKPNPKYPLTGDLSKFVVETTISNEEGD